LAKRIAFEKNQKWKDWSGTILVDEVGKVPGSWVGRNYAYKPITIKEGDNLFGKSLRVRVEEVFPTYLAGRLIR
jgi:tRNA A37 methylthiotransferase MiaB